MSRRRVRSAAYRSRRTVRREAAQLRAEQRECEPPEPDGEVFRGGEAAAYLAEQQAAAQRLK